MKKISISSIFCSFLLICCTNDTIPIIEDCDDTLSYNGRMSELIDRTCAYAGCHVSGFSDGDFSTYNGLLRDVESFPSEIYGNSMPPSGSSPQLSPEEIELFNCWVTNGYPEN